MPRSCRSASNKKQQSVRYTSTINRTSVSVPSNDWYFVTMKVSKLRLTHSLLRLTINFSTTTPSRSFVSHFCKKISSTSLRVYCPLKSETRESWRATNFPFPPVIYNFRTITGMRWSRAQLARLLVTKLTFYHDYGLVSGHASTCTRGAATIRTKSKSKGKKGAGDAAVVSQV